jgi:branched-chain amino acid transport system substrate-binding protein
MLKQQLVQHGYTGPFVSGDGIANDPRFIDQARAVVAQNTYATLAEPAVSTFTSGVGARFLRDYRTRYPGQQVNGDCANAYDAAMIAVTAIKNPIRIGNAVTRAAVIDQVQNIRYTGVTGAIRFDKNGDDVYGAYTVYTVQDGVWLAYERVAV